MQKILRQWPDSATGKLCGEWCYPAEDVDAMIEQLSEPERKLSAWINAARELALSCGMPESEQRTTRYLGYVKRKLLEVDQYRSAAERLEVE